MEQRNVVIRVTLYTASDSVALDVKDVLTAIITDALHSIDIHSSVVSTVENVMAFTFTLPKGILSD